MFVHLSNLSFEELFLFLFSRIFDTAYENPDAFFFIVCNLSLYLSGFFGVIFDFFFTPIASIVPPFPFLDEARFYVEDPFNLAVESFLLYYENVYFSTLDLQDFSSLIRFGGLDVCNAYDR